MDNTFNMMMTLALFGTIAEALRNPDKFDTRTRELMAEVVEKIADGGKSELTGRLMSEAVKDVPKGQ